MFVSILEINNESVYVQPNFINKENCNKHGYLKFTELILGRLQSLQARVYILFITIQRELTGENHGLTNSVHHICDHLHTLKMGLTGRAMETPWRIPSLLLFVLYCPYFGNRVQFNAALDVFNTITNQPGFISSY